MSFSDPVTDLPADTICGSCGHSLTVTPRNDSQDTVGSEGTVNFQSFQLTAGALLAGRYRIVTLIGHGGMGEVYQAEDLWLEQPVALKFFPQRVQQDGSTRARFYREVKLARQVAHPNVCRVFDVAEAEGMAFLTMEFVDGEDLLALLSCECPLAPDKALSIARQLCAGLAAAHHEGVLHRDLKPANIMLDSRQNVRITDFGLAAMAGETGQSWGTGTPIYMAPEQLRGEEISIQTDLYALGLVLYEIYTGKRPFTMESAAEAARSRQTWCPLLSGDLDPGLEKVILPCLDPNPARRPRSATEVGSALMDFTIGLFRDSKKIDSSSSE